MNVKLSKKHGLNPSIDTCFYCGEAKGVALLGKLRNDVEAPKNIILDIEPCDTCSKEFSKGILLIEVSSNKTNIQITEDYYATGSYWLVNEDLFAPNSKVVATRKGLITVNQANELGLYPITITNN